MCGTRGLIAVGAWRAGKDLSDGVGIVLGAEEEGEEVLAPHDAVDRLVGRRPCHKQLSRYHLAAPTH